MEAVDCPAVESSILRLRSANLFHAFPDTERSGAPRALHPDASPEAPARSEHTCHNRYLPYVPTLHQSDSTTGGRYLTSKPGVLWCTRWPPCPPDPAWLRSRARGCTSRLAGPGPLSSRAGPIVCL